MNWLVYTAVAAMLPRTESMPGVEDTGLDAFIRQYRAEGSALLWLAVVASALLFTVTPLFTVLVPLPAFWLPRRLRDAHASRFATSRLYLVRQTGMMLKTAAGLCWGRDAAVRAKLGLPPYGPDPGTCKPSFQGTGEGAEGPA